MEAGGKSLRCRIDRITERMRRYGPTLAAGLLKVIQDGRTRLDMIRFTLQLDPRIPGSHRQPECRSHFFEQR